MKDGDGKWGCACSRQEAFMSVSISTRKGWRTQARPAERRKHLLFCRPESVIGLKRFEVVGNGSGNQSDVIVLL